MPSLEISWETLDGIVVAAMKQNIEYLEKEQSVYDSDDNLSDEQKIDYFENAQLIKAMKAVLKYYGAFYDD